MINAFFTSTLWQPIALSAFCGALVGFERQIRGKPAGVRTAILVCMGTAVFIRLGVALGEAGADPTRVLGQLVTGIGFLGAGVMFSREGVVSGVTTAAVIWVLAAIGAAIGLGRYVDAVVISITTVSVLVGIELLESSVNWLTRGVHRREPETWKDATEASGDERTGED